MVVSYSSSTEECCYLYIVTVYTTGLAAEVTCLQEENTCVVEECGRLTEDNNRLAQDHVQLQDHSTKMIEELKSKFSVLVGSSIATMIFVICDLTAHVVAVVKINAKKHLEDMMKDWDGWKTRCQEITKDRDTWKGWCQEVAKSIMPVLDLLSLELLEGSSRTPPLGLIDKCQRAWGWLQQFVKEAGEYAGAHVLNMVCAHYALIDFTRLEAGYPEEVDPAKADELRVAQLDLSTKMIGDLNLCGSTTPPAQGTSSAPSTSQPAAPSTSRQSSMPTVSTSQTPTTPSSLA